MNRPKNNPFIQNPDTDFDSINELNEKQAERQAQKLREAIEYHDYRYYVKNKPIISDKAYDQLFRRLQKIEKEFNLVTESSPTQRVGGKPLDELKTVEHVSEMLSLQSSEDETDVIDWDERVRKTIQNPQYFCELKFDGLSVEIIYENNRFVRAVTRGNGIEGDDISENVKTIHSVPLKLRNAPNFIAIRGEIYMSKSGFQKLNKERIQKGKDPFANPRNAAAGSVRVLDPSVVAKRPLNVFFYEIMECSKELDTHQDAMNLLKDIGLRVNEKVNLVSDIKDFIKFRNKMNKQRDDLDYSADGVIGKINKFEDRRILGKTADHPRWAFAYKFPAKEEITSVEKIVVQVGRTGKLTPVALLDPVNVEGVTVSRASLHNASQVKKLGVSVGAKVKIKRAGGTIPEVVRVLESGKREFQMPDHCPSCGSKVEKEGEYHFCTGGISCPAQLKGSLEHYTSREAMNIEGVGEKIAQELVEENLIKEIPDLYNLNKDDLLNLEGFAEKSVQNLLDEIEDSKDKDLTSFLYALGIRHVGKETARLLAKNFSLEQLMNIGREDLEKLDDIGPKIAESITLFFSGEGRMTVKKLLDSGVNPKRRKRGDELEGLKIVITGAIEGYTRQELIEILEKHGGDVTSAVSSLTDYLIVGENPGSSKMEDADKYNVEKLNEKAFKDKVLGKII